MPKLLYIPSELVYPRLSVSRGRALLVRLAEPRSLVRLAEPRYLDND